MFKSILHLYSLLTPKQQFNLKVLQLLMIVSALLEIISIASVGPFIMLAVNNNILQENEIFKILANIIGTTTYNGFLIKLGTITLLIFVISSVISIFTLWRLNLYCHKIGAEISIKLFKYYIYQSWLYHTQNTSNVIFTKLISECQRLTNNITYPILFMNSKIILCLCMLIAILVYKPIIVLITVIFASVFYFIFYSLFKFRLKKFGQLVSSSQKNIFNIVSESFGGIKDVLFLGKQKKFIREFDKNYLTFGRSVGTAAALGQIPKYILELLGYGSVILIIIYIISFEDKNFINYLPILSVYALAGLKLLPAFQAIYSCVSGIKSNIQAFEVLKEDISKSKYELIESQDDKDLPQINSKIELKDISFAYPNKKNLILSNFNLSLPIKKVIGIVGETGSGKSTLIDIILGLIEPQSGGLYLDGKKLLNKQKRAWQNQIGVVPQNIFLMNKSIKENIAFELDPKTIDEEKIFNALKLSRLDKFVSTLPNGINTIVGERGVQLSGGQCQRVGIARALYNDPEFLLFDEATSSLDGITEKLIMDAIQDFSGNKSIIIITHRLSTIKICDNIFLIENGKVVDEGSYSTLIKNNDKFKKMAAEDN